MIISKKKGQILLNTVTHELCYLSNSREKEVVFSNELTVLFPLYSQFTHIGHRIVQDTSYTIVKVSVKFFTKHSQILNCLIENSHRLTTFTFLLVSPNKTAQT